MAIPGFILPYSLYLLKKKKNLFAAFFFLFLFFCKAMLEFMLCKKSKDRTSLSVFISNIIGATCSRSGLDLPALILIVVINI